MTARFMPGVYAFRRCTRARRPRSRLVMEFRADVIDRVARHGGIRRALAGTAMRDRKNGISRGKKAASSRAAPIQPRPRFRMRV